MATVATVYTIEPLHRRAQDMVRSLQVTPEAKLKRPRPHSKQVWASLVKDPKEVIEGACRYLLKPSSDVISETVNYSHLCPV